MKIPTVSHFCLCINLTIGGLIIGWLGVFGATISVYFAATDHSNFGISVYGKNPRTITFKNETF